MVSRELVEQEKQHVTIHPNTTMVRLRTLIRNNIIDYYDIYIYMYIYIFIGLYTGKLYMGPINACTRII